MITYPNPAETAWAPNFPLNGVRDNVCTLTSGIFGLFYKSAVKHSEPFESMTIYGPSLCGVSF